jgi:hypothetical protein
LELLFCLCVNFGDRIFNEQRSRKKKKNEEKKRRSAACKKKHKKQNKVFTVFVLLLALE